MSPRPLQPRLARSGRVIFCRSVPFGADVASGDDVARSHFLDVGNVAGAAVDPCGRWFPTQGSETFVPSAEAPAEGDLPRAFVNHYGELRPENRAVTYTVGLIVCLTEEPTLLGVAHTLLRAALEFSSLVGLQVDDRSCFNTPWTTSHLVKAEMKLRSSGYLIDGRRCPMSR